MGMFIHWGASSVLGAGEWVMNNRNIGVKEYSRLINIFNPQNFDAKKWVATAKTGGMKYITFITRHHDGFSNWDTKQSDWKITNTPYGKDALKQLADEQQPVAILLISDAVGDQAALERRSQLGSKVAHLVGVRHQHKVRLFLADELFEGSGKTVGRVVGQRG